MSARQRTEKGALERLAERIRTADRGWFFAAIAQDVAERRQELGYSQRELAELVGTTQSAIARLERPDSNPRVATLEAALRAAGRRLDVSAPARPPEVDEDQIREFLKLTPTERIRYHDSSRRKMAELVRKARRVPRDDLDD
jgi:transcriptional regulator with XRE-family HTH domain